jgi:hypothetical protein
VITRKNLDDRVDYLYARQILEKLIWNRLIMQEAQRKNCVPTDGQVQQMVAQIERTSPAIVDRARLVDPQLLMFKEDLATTMALRNIRIAGISVSDDEARTFYAAHKLQFALPVQSQTTTVIARDRLAADTARSLLTNGTEPALIAGRDGLSVVGIDANLTGTVPQSINEQVLRLKDGQIGEYQIGTQYMVVRIDKRSPAVIPSYESIQDQVAIAAKLAKAPPQDATLKELMKQANIHADSAKYKDVVSDVTKDIGASTDN